MGKSRALAVTITGMLVLAGAVPAAANDVPNEAKGRVPWAAQHGAIPGLYSVFRVRDGAPGTDTLTGDRGYYRLYRTGEKPGSLRLDVRCVRVESDWAEFAGIATDVTGVYLSGEVWLVSVKDSGKRGAKGDEIGMKSLAKDGVINTDLDLVRGCKRALNDKQFGRQGVISGGNIKIRHRD